MKPNRRSQRFAVLCAAAAASWLGLGGEAPVAPADAASIPSVTPAQPWSAPPAPQAPLAPPAIGSIRSAQGAILIDITAMPLAEAAHQLAAATQAALHGSEALLQSQARVTLKWSGSNAASAWQQLLEGAASYAAWCGERGCTVRVLGLSAPRAAAPAAGARGARPIPPEPQPDPPGLFPAEG